jgi:hypothetical protein
LLTPANSLAFATDTNASNAASLVFFEGSLQDNMTSPNRRDTSDPLVTISTALCFKTSEIARIRAGRAAADTEPTVDMTRPITLEDASACKAVSGVYFECGEEFDKLEDRLASEHTTLYMLVFVAEERHV